MHRQPGWIDQARAGLGGARGVVSGLLLALLLTACGKDQGSQQPPAASEEDVVARIGQTTLTVQRLNEEINQQNPYVRMRYSSPERKKEFVKNLIRFEVLAAEAERRDLEQDPEVIRRVKRVMIDKLMEQLQENLVKLDDISEQEVADYYKANKETYQQPPKVRVSQIVVKSEGEARQVLAAAGKKPGDIKHFNDLVQRHSIDEASKAKNGDLGFMTRESEEVPQPLREAAFAIKGMWQLGGPVKLEQGLAVLLKTGEVAAINRPLELEKNRIKNRLYNEKKIKAIEKYIEDLQQQAKVKINEANLAKVKVDMAPRHPGSPGSREPGAQPPPPARPGEPAALPQPGAAASPTKVR